MVNREQSFDRGSSLFVARGLYVLRYESGGKDLDHPLAIVRPSPGFETAIQIISAPGSTAGSLDRPGAALFIRAADHASLQIAVQRTRTNGSLDAALKLESVGGLATGEIQDADVRANVRELGPSSRTSPRTASVAGEASEALFVAHISRRGDVAVGATQWAAGPDAPARIEGLELRPVRTEGLRSEIQVLNVGREASWSPWAGPGVFAGSRGRSLPLVGVRLRLTGEQAHRHLINADALFLGSAIMNRRGREIELIGAAGGDPLVGFRFEICPERRLSLRQVANSPPRDAEPRIRVFRASASR